MTFDEFVRTPVQTPGKISKMKELLPRFEIGVSNDHSIVSMCRWLSENSDDFRGMSTEKIYRLYLQARKKAARVQQSKTPAAKPAPAPIPLPAPIPPPASAVAPPQPVASQKSSPSNPLPAERPMPADKPAPVQTPAPDSNNPYQKGEEAKERLKALGAEAADWAEPQGFFLERQDNDVMIEWMRMEPGRREMITDLVRTALRGLGSAKAEDPEYPDWLICNSYLGKGYSPRATLAKVRASNERAEAQKSPALRTFSGSY